VLLGGAAFDSAAAVEGLLARSAVVGGAWLSDSLAAGRLLVGEGEVERYLLEVGGLGGCWYRGLGLCFLCGVSNYQVCCEEIDAETLT